MAIGNPNSSVALWKASTTSGALEAVEGERAGAKPGVVVEEVEDLDRSPVGELPGRGVELPSLVGQPGFKPDEGATRSLVRLRRDQPVALEDPPDALD
jgi:hypothetical protein